MKKALIILLIVLVLSLFFSYTKVSVCSERSGEPVSFVSVTRDGGTFYTGYYGNLSFFRMALPERVKFSRFGYKEKIIHLPFALFFLNKRILLNAAGYTEIQGEAMDIFKKVTSYEYSYRLTVSGNNGNNSQELIAKFNHGDFFFENNSDFTGTHIKIWSINSKMYKSENNSYIKGPLTDEEKQALYQENMVFFPVTELFSSIFPSENPTETKIENDTIHFVWNNKDMEIKISEKGFPELVHFNSKDIKTNTTYKLVLEIKNINEEVKIEK